MAGAEATATVKEEVEAWSDLNLLSCLDGFALVLGAEGEVVFVSGNVSASVGLTPVEMLGQSLDEFVHPCDLVDCQYRACHHTSSGGPRLPDRWRGGRCRAQGGGDHQDEVHCHRARQDGQPEPGTS